MADSIVLQFTNDAKVVQFLTTAPGTSFARLIDFDLGAGYTVLKADDRSAIYNPHDDKMYFLGTKSGTHFLVQYDPRTLAVTDEMELPVGWTLSGSTLCDCTDSRAWITGDDGSTREFNIDSMTQIFTDGGAFIASPYSTDVNSMISCSNGVALLEDEADPTLVHRITVTGSTTFTDATVSTTGNVIWASNGSFRRRWNPSLNLVVVSYETFAPAITPVGTIIDVAALICTDIPAPVGASTLFDNGIFWDMVSNKFVGSVAVATSSFGIGVFNADGTYVGTAALDSPDAWTSGAPAMPLGNDLVWSINGLIFAGGGFDMTTPIVTPAVTYDATSATSTPSGVSFDYTTACIAPGTAVPPSVDVPRIETSIGGGGSCGVQFERLEMFHLLKSLMGSGRTLEQAMKFLEQDDVDFLEEEELLDDLPQEIPKPARQGTSPKMVDRRINLAPITKLNSLIAEFETKLQNCRTKQRGEYEQ